MATITHRPASSSTFLFLSCRILEIMVHVSRSIYQYIPKAFATVLFGSKYGYKQNRGTFGLGGTMALLYGHITTNKPAT